MADDRPYTRDEIKQLVDAAHSLRDKAIILLLSSSCKRVGGLVRLQLKHLIPNDKYGTFTRNQGKHIRPSVHLKPELLLIST